VGLLVVTIWHVGHRFIGCTNFNVGCLLLRSYFIRSLRKVSGKISYAKNTDVNDRLFQSEWPARDGGELARHRGELEYYGVCSSSLN
ncbi:MAG: hypothetical protein EBU88_18420, partial [Acidobacteria bacterium]|nr:hypothetical protein [Acidobacteriota bacterium]